MLSHSDDPRTGTTEAREDAEAVKAHAQRRYVLISPGRDEEAYLRRTLDSVAAQTELPALWVIVDDGSQDATPRILQEYADRYDWIRIVTRRDRGRRAVGAGVIEAFRAGLQTVRLNEYEYICKLDLDLDLPRAYFAGLMDRMEGLPRLGSCSGKPYFRSTSGRVVSEKCGDEMSVGMTKFYRVSCFDEIGGFVSQVMWDAIDVHKSRQLGWTARSWDDPELRFEHLRPMGSSQSGVLTGRMRHGYGQYYMGSDFLYFTATCLFRMLHPPFILGGLASWWGYAHAWAIGTKQHEDGGLRRFVQHYQRQALLVGKRRAIRQIEDQLADRWRGGRSLARNTR